MAVENLSFLDAVMTTFMHSLTIGGPMPSKTNGGKWVLLVGSTISATYYLSAIVIGVRALQPTSGIIVP